MRFHGSCAARLSAGGSDAVLLLGGAGSGKSDFLLRLIGRGWRLVADDQVLVTGGCASAPPVLAGILEVRGLGLFRLPFLASAPLRLVVSLGGQVARLPAPALHDGLGLPEIALDPVAASAPERLELALDAVTGRAAQIVGAFAA
jgi:HPr kinase/phosphorylase